MKLKGMLPDEYARASLVIIYPESPLESLDGSFAARRVATGREEAGLDEKWPEFYIPIVRRKDGKFDYQILKAEPVKDAHIPHEVMERIISERDRIISEGRSDSGKAAWATRRAREEAEQADDDDDDDDSVVVPIRMSQ